LNRHSTSPISLTALGSKRNLPCPTNSVQTGASHVEASAAFRYKNAEALATFKGVYAPQGEMNEITHISDTSAGTFYDRIARLYDWTFKVNGYRRSIERFLLAHPLPLPSGARILDAGCGTGLLTLSLLRTLQRPAQIVAIDLSASSLLTARRATEQHGAGRHTTSFFQANLLSLPFADESFDFIITSGALEYVSLDDGLRELARVTAPGGYFLHLPVRPSPVSKLLEIIFRFRAHPVEEIVETTNRYFRILLDHRFASFEPIGWTKIAILARKEGG
jgi:ubiquinone/menaquinone biosynthesis C-methylase UbiE